MRGSDTDREGAGAEVTPPPVPPLSEEMENLLSVAHGEPLSLRTIVEHLHFRGLPLLIAILCVPFIIPIAIPGMSTPFGAAIALCGLRLGLGHQLWLPDFLLRREVKPELLRKIVRIAAGFYRRIEKLVRPRMHFLQRWPGMLNLLGFMIMAGGIMLALPIPIPLTNTLPAIAVALIALGMMERDGVVILLGYFFALLAVLYLVLIAVVGMAGMKQLWTWFLAG
jgi:hypothetical protein